MLKLSYVSSAIAMLMAAGSASAAVDVVVNSTQPEVAGVSYQTVNSALTYAKSQSEPRLVRITGGGPYQESLAINFSVTVKGDGFKPVIVTPPTAGLPNASLNGNGVAFYTNADFPGDQSFRLENLSIIPAVGSAPTRAIRSNNNNSGSGLTAVHMLIEFQDVVVTANNGSNVPVSMDGLSKVDLTGATVFGDDTMYFAGFADVYTTNTVITNLYGNAASVDGILFIPDAARYSLNLGPGTVISYQNRTAIQMATGGSILNMHGTRANPVVIKGNYISSTRNSAISIFSSNGGVTDVNYTWDNVVFVDNNSRAVGLGLIADNVSAMGLDADNIAFSNNKEGAIIIADGLTRPWSFKNTTIAGNVNGSGTGFIPAVVTIAEGQAGFNTGAVTFTDSIIAGNGSAGNTSTGDNLIDISAPNMPVSFINCGLPTAGPYSLGTGKYKLADGVAAPTETNVKSEDPEFVHVSADFSNTGYLDVNSPAYDNAATGGADLKGYGDYVGGSSVNQWNLY